MSTPTVPYSRGAVLTSARCKDCDWSHHSYGEEGPQKTRAAVRYHVSVKRHMVQVEVRRFRNYGDGPCPA